LGCESKQNNRLVNIYFLGFRGQQEVNKIQLLALFHVEQLHFTLIAQCFILLLMFAVIRHTFDINKDDTDNMYADWKHYVWLFEDEVDAMAFAITFLDDPLLKANADYMEHAIEMLHEKRFWQIGRESVAIGKVADSPTIIYEEEDDHEKSIH